MTVLAERPSAQTRQRSLRAGLAGRFAAGAGYALLRSLSIVLPVLLVATFITFLLGSVTGQDPASMVLGDQARPEDIERMRAYFGLDQPVLVRYADWLVSAFQGDLGESWFTRIPVMDSIVSRLPVSFSIAIYALLLGTVAGVVLGIAAAVNNGGWIDRTVTLLASVLSTIPGFVAAVALVVALSVLMPVFPSGGYVPPEQDVGLWIRALTLPAIALSLDTASDIARQLRTGLVGALQENYVVGATVRGFSRSRVVLVHGLRNGAGPAVAVLGMHVPRLIGGAVVTETVFAMPGLGLLTKQAALQGDVPVVQGALFVSILLVVASSAIVNVLLVALRPAARRES
ncbi:ABC transporter permease [Microbacterium marinilacus]|uniref:ABC transporter permease n=1 Tax=Microbacterium marinilacus TaxID=415209 RepID=A0ABP7BCP3_9MICO|nr:ABC transporter permease [Microbacterium marinilacus]MBY0690231.1 ABC transporter permease [Microbacterium marinilacus]